MRYFKLFLGMLWASPITLFCFLLYVLPMWILGFYSYYCWDEIAWVWHYNPTKTLDKKLGMFVVARWARWTGQSVGNIIVIKEPVRVKNNVALHRTMLHKKERVKQMMKLGIFMPIIYALNYIVGRFVLENADGYYDNIFEIDARRKAGQLIDIVGAVNQLKSLGDKPPSGKKR